MIWKRYFLKELAKTFLLFMGSFYFLYVLIDYSIHSKAFYQGSTSFADVLLYYVFHLTKRADILIPIALLISTVKVLTTSNVRNEIIALVCGGLSFKALMGPFFFAGIFCSCLLYLNFQFLQPLSLSSLSILEQKIEGPIEALPLSDQSLLLYQKFDPLEQAFFDVYWFQDFDVVYRIHTLYPYEEIPLAKHVDIIQRNQQQLRRTQSHAYLTLPTLKFDKKNLFNATHPPSSQSLTSLISNITWKESLNDREAKLISTFFYKLFIPLSCLLVMLAPAPFCLNFKRHLPVFVIYVLSLFGIITFFTFVNSCVILAESQVLPPFWALMIPFALFFSFFGWRYAKL